MSYFLDIGVNLTDTMYQGEYHGKTKHQPDLDKVLERSWQNGLEKMIITGGSLEDAKKALEVAKTSGEHKRVGFRISSSMPSSLQINSMPQLVVIPQDAMNSMSLLKVRKATLQL